ncbi:DUF1648 domain-containing protein [Zafaria sp. Z1313]|uniref:DUF1648 domain-containing protein n=1 Tax=Zafaria sp. Z1313 TaxID=3423202 RepID=UPI003D301C63
MRTTTGPELAPGRRRPWVPFLGATAVFAALAVYGASLYDGLPETVPTQFGVGGEADAWGEKSVGTVFGPLIVGVGLTVLLALLAYMAPAMSPPPKDATAWTAYRREGMLRGTVAGLGWTCLFLAMIMGVVMWATWHPGATVPTWPLLLGTFAIIGGVVACSVRYERWSERAARDAGVVPTGDEVEDDRKWIGGVFYNDPSDPHLLVPKREGTGYGLTVNVGNRKGRVAVVVFLLLTVGPLVLLPILLG